MFLVLGGLTPTRLTSSNDLNNIKNTGWKMYYTANADNPANTPSAQDCYNNIIWCYKQGDRDRYMQVLYSENIQKYFIRACVTGTWYAWQEISVNIPSFYKNYSDLVSLVNAMNVCKVISGGQSAAANTPNSIYNTSFSGGVGFGFYLGTDNLNGVWFEINVSDAGTNKGTIKSVKVRGQANGTAGEWVSLA